MTSRDGLPSLEPLNTGQQENREERSGRRDDRRQQETPDDPGPEVRSRQLQGPQARHGGVVTEGPAAGYTIQKFDPRQYMNDEWSKSVAQLVGVKVQNESLLELYRRTIIDFSQQQ